MSTNHHNKRIKKYASRSMPHLTYFNHLCFDVNIGQVTGLLEFLLYMETKNKSYIFLLLVQEQQSLEGSCTVENAINCLVKVIVGRLGKRMKLEKAAIVNFWVFLSQA